MDATRVAEITTRRDEKSRFPDMFQQEESMSKTRVVVGIFLLLLSSNLKLFGQAYHEMTW